MPEIEIRPAIASHIPAMMALDHNYTTEHVWQMEIDNDEKYIRVNFREVHLPRSVQVEYPRPYQNLADQWTQRSGLLVALLAGEVVGYVSLMLETAPATAWITDLVVARALRRQGIASTMILAAQEWSNGLSCRRLVMEMQPKNQPAIRLAQKIGFDFCGYNDSYYANGDIGLFFAKHLG